jgi:hypothetical protein
MLNEIYEIWRRVKLARINKETVKNILGSVPDEKNFWVNDGRVLRNLKDLSVALVDMDEDTFKHHVNKEKNDFKNWINDVIGDNKLAKDISKTKNQKVMENKINRRIEQLTKTIK